MKSDFSDCLIEFIFYADDPDLVANNIRKIHLSKKGERITFETNNELTGVISLGDGTSRLVCSIAGVYENGEKIDWIDPEDMTLSEIEWIGEEPKNFYVKRASFIDQGEKEVRGVQDGVFYSIYPCRYDSFLKDVPDSAKHYPNNTKAQGETKMDNNETNKNKFNLSETESERQTRLGVTFADEKIDFDAVGINGCTLASGSDITVMSQASVVENTKILKGGKLHVFAGMVVDVIVEEGGYLELEKNCVWYHVYVKSGGEIKLHTNDTDNLLIDKGAIVHTNTAEVNETKTAEEQEHDKMVETMLEEDAKNAQFTEGACGKSDENDECQYEEGDEDDESLVDSKNRTCLYIEGCCNYENVLDDILYLQLRYEDHTFTITTDDADDCIDVEGDEDNLVKIYIRRLPRFLDVEDFDLVLTDVVMRDDAPDDLHLDISLVKYEDAIVDVDLDDGHDYHVFSVVNNGDDPDVKIILRGDLMAPICNDWSTGHPLVKYNDKTYIVEEHEDRRKDSMTSDGTFEMEIHPSHLVAPDKTQVTGEDMLTILHGCKLVDYVNTTSSTPRTFNECIIDGKAIVIDIPYQNLSVNLYGYTLELPTSSPIEELIFSSSEYDSIRMTEAGSTHVGQHNTDTNEFSIEFCPDYVIATKNGNKEVIPGTRMVDLLRKSQLEAIKFIDEQSLNSMNRLELTGCYLGSSRIPIKLKEESKFYNLFRYTQVAPPEKEGLDCGKDECGETLELVLLTKHNRVIPDVDIRLSVVNDEPGLETYKMCYNHMSEKFLDDQRVALKFYDATFKQTDGSKIIKSSKELKGRRKAFSPFVVNHDGTSQTATPISLKYGEIGCTWLD